jgi:hypothetical protein
LVVDPQKLQARSRTILSFISEKLIMTKTLFATAFLGLALSTTSFAADKMKMVHCDAGSMKAVMADISAMKDPAMKKHMEMAMGEVHKAEMAMKKHDMKGCDMHLNMAKKETMMKKK